MLASPPDSAASFALSYYRLPEFVCRSRGNAGGFSGARIWKIDSFDQSLCLKAWPSDQTPGKLSQVHEWMAAPRRAGLRFVPDMIRAADGKSFREHNDRLWDLAEWMLGNADFRLRPSAKRITAACSALAMLHDVWAGSRSDSGPCPAVIRRMAALTEGRDLLQSGWRPTFGPADNEQLTQFVKEVWPLLPRLLSEQASSLMPYQDVAMRIHPCLCDIWHDHVLFVNDSVSGIIDYGSMRIDSPATDLARLLGSMVGDDDSLFRAGMDAYRSIRRDATPDLRLVQVLDRSGIVIAVMQWLKWLYIDRRPFDDSSAVAQRLGQLTARLLSPAWAKT